MTEEEKDQENDIKQLELDSPGPAKPPGIKKGRFQVACNKGMGQFTKFQTVGLMTPLTLFMLLDLQIYNVAIYPISLYYGISTTVAQWMILVRSITNTTFCLFTSVILDKLGVRKHLIIFTLGISVTQFIMPWGPFWFTVLFRGLGCVCIALISSLSSSAIRLLTDNSQMRGAMGLTTIVRSVGSAIAPTLGGVLCDLEFGWRSIPLLLGGVSVVVVLSSLLFFPNIYLPKRQHIKDAKVTRNPNFDVIGSLTLVSSVLTISIVFAVFSVVAWYYLIAMLVFAAVMITLFVLHERRITINHIIDPRIFKNKPVTFGLLSGICLPMGQKIIVVLIPLMFQQVYGLTSTMTGVTQSIMLPLGQILSGVLSPVLCRKFPPHIVLTVCFVISGILGLVTSLCFLVSSWLLVAVLGFLSSFSSGLSMIINGSNILMSSPQELGPMVGSLQTLIGSFSGSIGTTLAVTLRDILVPVFEDPVNPTKKQGLRMGSFISGSILSAIVLLCSILTFLSKPRKESDCAPILVSGEIPLTDDNSLASETDLPDGLHGSRRSGRGADYIAVNEVDSYTKSTDCSSFMTVSDSDDEGKGKGNNSEHNKEGGVGGKGKGLSDDDSAKLE